MRKINLVIFGESDESIADAAECAATLLRKGVASESITWDDRSHLSYDAHQSNDTEYCEFTNDEPKPVRQ
jgi:hypothetical protein